MTGTKTFAERCADPNVVACFGFDTAAEANSRLTSSGHSAPSFDNTTPAEGGGSIHMRVLPGSGADTSGQANVSFPGIGQGNTLYVQWRQRFSAAFVNTPFDSLGWKQIVLHENTSNAGCSESEVVVANHSIRGFPSFDHSCGIWRESTAPAPNNDLDFQPGGANRCLYSWLSQNLDYLEPSDDLAETACLGYAADQWMTFQIAVELNQWCQADEAQYHQCPQSSRLKLWITYEGQAPLLAIDLPFAIRTVTNPLTTVYDKLQLTPYQTSKNTGQNHAPADLWYDSVIISKARIAEPK